MSAKHTPGPWCLFPIETGWIVNQQGGAGYVGTMHSVSHRAEECEANARLIASAPDLLEALTLLRKDIDAYFGGSEVGPVWPKYFDTAMSMAASAIASAQGTEQGDKA